MNLSKSLLSTFLLGCSLLLSAQESNDVSSYAPRDWTIIPPAPEVASMMRNVDFPVTPFSGQPDISFPIYTITEGSLSIPISIQYQSGGLKVDDQPGNLGHSWNLIAGGCISRTVYGHPDEANNSNNIKGLFHITPESNSLREFAKSTIAEFDPSDYNYFMTNRTGNLSWGEDYYYGLADMANDILKVSCMNISGTFIYDDNKNICINSPQPISISPSHIIGITYPTSYLIIDNSGTKYYFEKEEKTKYEYYHGVPGNQALDSMYYTSAWHLTKIKNLQNDSIIFHYDTKKKRTRVGATVETYYYSSNPQFSSFVPDKVTSTGNIIYNPVYLKSIESSSAIVKFTYDNDSKTEKITKIAVYTNNDSNTPVKEFNFSYTKFDNYEEEGPKRTFLTNISENGQNQYKFKYYTSWGSDNEITCHPFDQDFCGYYNEAMNTELAPYIIGGDYAGSNREVNPDVCYLGSLKSIEYPTGGSTEFEWESHDYSYYNNFAIEGNSSSTHISTQQIDTLNALKPINKLVIDNYSINSYYQFVTIDLSNYFNFNPQILLSSDFYGLCHEYANCIGLHYPRISFIDKRTNQTCAEHTVFIDNCSVNNNNGLINVYLEPNVDYRVELQYPTSITSSDGFDTKALIEQEFFHADADCGKIFLRKNATTGGSSSSRYKDYWGGVRIARIISKADNDSEPIIKGYSYGDPLFSTGVISTKPNYTGKYYYVSTSPLCPGFNPTLGFGSSEFHQVSSNGFYNLPTGNIGVEYSRVTEWCSHQIEKEIDTYANSNNIEYTYSTNFTHSYRDYNYSAFLDFQPTSSQMWTSKSHYRGNLLSKQFKNYTGTSEKIKIDYEYNIFEPDIENLSIFTTDLFRIADFNTAPVSGMNTNGYDYSIGKYNLIPYNKTIKQEIYRELDYNDTTRYTYFYDSYTDNLDYNLLRSKIKTTSDGKTKETFYTYRYVNGVYLNIPETEVTVVDGTIVDAKRMVYNNNNLLIKSYGLRDKGINASEYNLGGKSTSQQLINLINQPEYSYEYNNHGDLVQISYNNEVLASYLWGYRGSYPIVEVKNLPYSELLSTINSIGKSPENFYSATSTIENDLTSFYNSLRNALPNYDITTMTYHWLIGVSSATDSRGITTHFSFDNQGRLSSIKDYNGYFIRKYDYHYKQ